MGHLFVFGLGYSASRISDILRGRGWRISETGSAGNVEFDDRAQVAAALEQASHVLSSVPPDKSSGDDPVLAQYGDLLGAGWLGYLSSTGVYGDTAGAWVDESAATVGQGSEGRRSARAQADTQWLDRGARVFRLPGIYGPGRSALDRVRQGKARRIAFSEDAPQQVFSRVHVRDIARGVIAGLEAPAGAYNLADDFPASGNDVTAEACRLLGVDPPPLQSLEEAGLSPAARGFYAENRRITNGKAKRVLGWQPEYPSFKEGLASLMEG